MAQLPIKVVPVEGIDLDSDALRISRTKAVFIKNLTANQHKNTNGDNGTDEGGNSTVFTPFEGSEILANIPAFPAGKNVCIGSYASAETYENYIFVYNNLGNHFIYVFGKNTAPTIVYKNTDLNFQLNPEYYISEGRCTLELRQYTDSTGAKRFYKFLFFTDNFNAPRSIEVNSSIATNYYDTALPYFDNTNNTYDRTRLINLGVITPSECIGIEPIPRSSLDGFEQNQMVNRMWQWRIMYKTRFGEVSAYGIISDQYTPVIGSGCVAGADGLPRCVTLTIEAGNPFVEWIEIAFRINNGDWKKYDTIQKYDNTTGVPWYQRPLSADLVAYNPVNNKFEYTFCGDKQWDILPQEETNRIENYLPKISATVFPLDQSLGLGNNLRGFEPIKKDQLDKIDIVVVDPTSTCTDNPLRTVVVYALILNYWQYQDGQPLILSQGIVSKPYQPSHAPTNAEFGDPDIWWGVKLWDNPGLGLVPDNSTYWGQFFRHEPDTSPNAPRNFTGFFAGTPFAAEAKQVRRDGLFECEVGIWDYASPPTICDVALPEGCILQRFEFNNLPPDTYVFRMCNHKAVIDPLGEYQKTSTTVYGTADMGNLNAANMSSVFAGFTSSDKEIVIDCTNGDVILNNPGDKALVILDLAMIDTPFITSEPTRRTYDGYLSEDEVDTSRTALERMLVTMPSPTTSLFTPNTDHNGYWFVSYEKDDADQPITGSIAHPTHAAVDDCNSVLDINLQGTNELDGTGQPYSAGGFWFQLKAFAYTGLDQFPEEGRTRIIGRKLLCGGIIGLQNFPMVVEGGLFDKTNSGGAFNIIVHNWGGIYASSDIRIVMSGSGSCVVSDCNDSCNFDKPIEVFAQLACGATPRQIDLGDDFYGVSGVNLAGLQNGGLYQFCIQGFDWNGRRTFAQTIDKFRVPIKSISETQVYGYSTIRYLIDGSILLPSYISYITFGVTPNLNFSSFFTWISDQAQFVDSTGKTNNANPEYIRIYYPSLSEYNKNFDYKTNSTWQLLSATDTIQTIRQNDQIEIIQKGDGTWPDKRIVADVQYDSEGQFFTIKYNADLQFLADPLVGPQTIIKFMRPKDFQDNSPYFEVCGKIPVVNGVPTILSGVIPAVDSYMFSRRIPIPIPLTNTDGTYQTTGNSNNTSTPLRENDIIKFFDDDTAPDNNEVQFTTKFEHDSPSDFWGEKVTNRGRINVINPYEAEERFGNEIVLSKAFSATSNFNGLSYFDSADALLFNQENWGDIVCVIPDMNRILFICEFDHFLAGYKESGMRTGSDGLVMATQNIGNFSIPQKRQGQEYGCQLYEINTIRKHKGIVYWLDSSRQALVQCDYNTGSKDVAIINKYKSYINKKVARHNAIRIAGVNLYPIFIGGINPRNDEYLLTYNQIPTGAGLVAADPVFTNLSLSLDYAAVNDTIIIDLFKGYLKCFSTYTPEYYCMAESLDNTLVSIAMGKAWLHNFHPNVVYNNFFGVQAKKVLEVIYNSGPEKVKRWLYNEVYVKEHMFIADRVISEVGQVSKILSAHWRKGEHFYQAPILCDVNTTFQVADQAAMTPKAVAAGDLMSGRWLKVRYISQNADDNKYCEISAVVGYALGIDKSVGE